MLCGEALSPGVCPALRLFSVFAAFLQSPKSFSRHLQHSCKPQKVFRSTCSVAAEAKKFFEALAGFLQTPKSSSRPLRNFRKRQNGENGPCGTSASVQKEKMAFAELPQASKRRKWRLQNSRKRPKGENGVCGTSAKADLFSETPVPPPLKTPALAMDIAGEWKNENGRIPEACAPQVPGRICWRTLLIPSVCRG